jgi:fibronectin-binding autotransporter adhesin
LKHGLPFQSVDVFRQRTMKSLKSWMAAMLLVSVAPSLQAASPSTVTWDGGGSDDAVDTKNNWNPNSNISNGDFLIFAGSVRTLPQLLADLTVGSITFDNTAAAFTIGGSSTFTVNAGGIINNDANTQTINAGMKLGATQTWTADSGNLTFGGALNKNSQGLIIDGGFNTTISGIVSSSGALTKNGTGTLVLSGANTFSGATTVNAGVLSLRHNTALGTSVGSTTIVSGGALELQNTISVSGESLTLAGTGVSAGGALRNRANNNIWSGTIALGAGGARINSDSGLLTLAGNISGAGLPLTMGGAGDVTISSVIGITSGTLTKDGAGTLTLSGANTYTGLSTISAGKVRIGSNAGLGTTGGNTTVASGAALEINSSGLSIAEVVSSLMGSGISNGGALRNLANDNTWSGAITLGSGGARINSDSGTLTLSGAISGAAQPLTVGGVGNVTVSGVIGTTSGTLTKDGNGTLILSGANTFTGATTVSAGTLKLGASGALSDSSAVSITSGAAFDLNGNNETIGSLAGAGNVTLGAGNLIAGGANTSTTHSGVISGTGGLAKRGTGTLILSGNNTYTGATAIDAGVLRISGSVANSAFAINNGGRLSGDGTTGPMVVNGGGTIAPGINSGTLSSGAQTWAGGGNYLWEINKANGTKGGDPGWDFLSIAGSLTVSATSGSRFNIGLTSLNLASQSGQASSFDNTQDYAWTIATASGGFIGFDALKFNLDASAFQNALGGGSFGIGLSGNDLNLTFTAVPEPHEYALIVGLGLLGFAIWRRRQQRPI